jgi:ankyrin repeat protein
LKSNKYSIAELLLNYGANPNVVDINSGDSPLLIALKSNKYSIVIRLLNYGANPNVIDINSGDSLLFIAVKSNKYLIVESLLNKNANLHFYNNNESIFQFIIKNNLTKIINLNKFQQFLAINNIGNKYKIPECVQNEINSFL